MHASSEDVESEDKEACTASFSRVGCRHKSDLDNKKTKGKRKHSTAVVSMVARILAFIRCQSPFVIVPFHTNSLTLSFGNVWV